MNLPIELQYASTIKIPEPAQVPCPNSKALENAWDHQPVMMTVKYPGQEPREVPLVLPWPLTFPDGKKLTIRVCRHCLTCYAVVEEPTEAP